MSIRDLNLNDLRILEREAKFPLPKLEDGTYILKKSIEEDGELIGSFWTKLTSEISLIISPEAGKLKAARAICEIESFLLEELRRLGINDAHVFIKDSEYFSKFLIKHFLFRKIEEEGLFRRF